jgi:protein phosphatase
MQVGYRSETGHVRKRNEDALLVDAGGRVFAVADGMGGHPAGDVASAVAIARLKDFFQAYDESDPAATVVSALEQAHEAVMAEAEAEPDRRGMGSTAVVALLADETAWVAHVGDSRCYLLADADGLRRVTDDHGAGGYLTQALGLDRGITPDVVSVPMAPGNRLVLCTDGLTNMVDDRDIAAILREAGEAQAACDALTSRALDAGGVDNVTVIVIDC